MKKWGTSTRKMEELCELLDQWYITNFFFFIGGIVLSVVFTKLHMLILFF
jgi:hypothetical protein